MPFRFVIKRKGRRAQSFMLTTERTLVGRGKDSDLLLPDISVSRHHARVELRKNDAWIIDLNSQNGTKVNGSRVTEAKLVEGDELQIGKFLLVFDFKPGRQVEEDKENTTITQYNVNERTGFLRRVTATEGVNAHSTTQFTPDQLDQLRKAARVQDTARVLQDGGGSWDLGERGMRFGKGSVDPGGLGIGGAAQIHFDGRRHVLEKLGGFFLKISVNGKPLKASRPLEPGDVFTVGDGRFRYEV